MTGDAVVAANIVASDDSMLLVISFNDDGGTPAAIAVDAAYSK